MGLRTKSSLVAKASRADYEKALIVKILEESEKNNLPVLFKMGRSPFWYYLTKN
jgi:hypothetical protein